MDFTQYTAQSFTLAQEMLAGNTYTTLDFEFTTAPLFTEGIIKVDKGEQSEWVVIENLALVSGETTIYRADVISRGLDKDASTLTSTSTDNQKDHSLQAECDFVTHSYSWNQKAGQPDDNTFTGDNTVTGSLSFTGTSEAGLKLQQVTTAQRDALTNTNTGTLLYNTTVDAGQVKTAGGTYTSLATGDTNPNASETVKGKVKLGTVSNQEAAALDTNVVQTQYLKKSSSATQTDDHGKIIITDATGKITYTFLPSRSRKFGGDASDGILSNSVTYTGANDTYVVKNYASVTGTAKTITITPTNCITHIKVKGDASFVNWTFNFKGKGAQPTTQGGSESAGGVNTSTGSANGLAGAPATRTNSVAPRMNTQSAGGGGGTFGAAGAGGTAATTLGFSSTLGISERTLLAETGQSGGGGGGGYNNDQSFGAVPPYLYFGGTGGAGGGCLILEVFGNLDLTGATIDIRGNDGSTGSAGLGSGASGIAASGGGGGGAGGTFLCIYGGTLTGSPTVNLTGGAGGAAGATLSTSGGGGGGGAGGSNVWATGTNGSTGNSSGVAGAGGAGASGVSIMVANTVFS